MVKNDFTSGIILFCIAAFFAIESLRMPVYDEFYTAPGMFPFIIALVLAAMSVWLIVRSLRGGRPALQTGPDVENAETGPAWNREVFIRTLVIVVALTVYVILMTLRMPYLIITALFLIATLFYFHPGHKIKNLIISVVVAFLMDYLFSKVFLIPLP